MSMLQEFKTFALRGNVVDMAVGIIIGAAFGKIVTSLVADVVMPPIGVLVGGMDFSKLAITLQATSANLPEVTLNYGKFLQSSLDFIIVALAVFLLVRGINSLKKKEAEKPKAPLPPSREEVLLAEIRDLLKSR